MEIILSVIAVAAVAFALAAMHLRAKAGTEVVLARQQVEFEQAEKAKLAERLDVAEAKLAALSEELSGKRAYAQALEAKIELETARHKDETELRRSQFEQQVETMREQFANIAAQTLEKTAKQLKESNVENIDSITKPLGISIGQLRSAIESTTTESAKNTATLTQQLADMGQRTEKISKAADRLATVIRGGAKQQGHWGERLLTDILDSQGMTQGVDYDIQQTIRQKDGSAPLLDSEGRKKIPDVIVHYPKGEELIIDSKVSIDAYYQYVNTEDESLKLKYADDLARNIRAQAASLAKKDYTQYISPDKTAAEFVVMFVPFDDALALAMRRDTRIWADAFSNKVLLTGQQNLMAVIRIVQTAWRQYAQAQNQAKVFALADELVKRVGDFYQKFQKVGAGIDSLQKAYDLADKKISGRQSLVQKAREIVELGAKQSPNHPLPELEADFEELG